MSRPSDANHACKVKPVRLNGSPEAKLINRTAVIRLSLSACLSVGFAAAVKRRSSTAHGAHWQDMSLYKRCTVTMRIARDNIRPHMSLAYQSDFIDLCVRLGVLKFGSFTLKSGRESPYFFNAGLFNTGAAIAAVGRAYAAALAASDLSFDMLYGPAYKGIPLVTVTAAAMAQHHGRDLPFAFNRKESKDHGEGGRMIGSPLQGRVLIVDDVITAGTAIRESIDIIQGAGAHAGRRPDRVGSPGTRRRERPFRRCRRCTASSPYP